MTQNLAGPREDSRPGELRSIARSIEPAFPDAADRLRGIASTIASVVTPEPVADDRGQVTALTEGEVDILRATIFRMAEDLTRIKQVCSQEHPPKMASPTKEWPAGTETTHSDGSRCVLLNDGDCAVRAQRAAPDHDPTTSPEDQT